MASVEWIRRTVETQGRPCPYRMPLAPAQRKCPGTREGCAFWVEEVLSRDGSRDVLVQPGCLIAYQMVQAHEEVLESQRAQAAVNEMAAAQSATLAAALARPTETRVVVVPLAAETVAELMAAQQRAALNGGHDARDTDGSDGGAGDGAAHRPGDGSGDLVVRGRL